MKLFRRLYCRKIQFIFKLSIPIMPYREPKILSKVEEISPILKERQIDSVLLVTDGGISKLGLTKNLENNLIKNNIKVTVYDKTVPNPTIDNVEEALKIYKDNSCNAIIAFGGGSPMDCAKAVGARVVKPNKPVSKMKGLLKVRKKLPLLFAVPTTAGTGSETTLAAVITDSNTKHKYAINDFSLIPSYAVLDETLTINLPKQITSTTGMDALTHAVEAFIGKSTTKQTRQCSLDATKLIFENLENAYNDGGNIIARKNMLKAAYLAGVAFTKSYVGYVHAVAHSLGGQYGVPHGYANAVILPYFLKEYGETIYKKLKDLAVYSGIANISDSPKDAAQKFISKVEDMNKKMGIPTKIAGIKEEDIPLLSHHADKEGNPLYPVPKLMNQKELAKMYLLIKE